MHSRMLAICCLLFRPKYDDRNDERQHYKCAANDNYWWLDKLGIFWISNK